MWQKAGILHGFLEVPISQHATTCNHFSQKVDKKICLEGIEISSLFDFTCLMVLPNKRGTYFGNLLIFRLQCFGNKFC